MQTTEALIVNDRFLNPATILMGSLPQLNDRALLKTEFVYIAQYGVSDNKTDYTQKFLDNNIVNTEEGQRIVDVSEDKALQSDTNENSKKPSDTQQKNESDEAFIKYQYMVFLLKVNLSQTDPDEVLQDIYAYLVDKDNIQNEIQFLESRLQKYNIEFSGVEQPNVRIGE